MLRETLGARCACACSACRSCRRLVDRALHSRNVSVSRTQRRRHRRRPRRPDGGRGARARRRRRHRLRRDAVGRPQIPDGRARRAQSHPQRTAAGIPRALPRGDAASGSRDRGVSAAGVARLERGAGAADLRRLQRPGVSKGVQGLAAAARVAAAAGFDGRAVRAASSLDRLGRAAAVCCFKRRTDSAPSKRARPCWRSAAQAGRGSAPMARGSKRSLRKA